MDEQEWNNILQGCLADLQANLPKVTGQMTRKTRAISTWGNDVIGEIIIEVPYATFVNYGFKKHPNSKKLKRDYKIVETTIKHSLKVRAGGNIDGN